MAHALVWPDTLVQTVTPVTHFTTVPTATLALVMLLEQVPATSTLELAHATPISLVSCVTNVTLAIMEQTVTFVVVRLQNAVMAGQVTEPVWFE